MAKPPVESRRACSTYAMHRLRAEQGIIDAHAEDYSEPFAAGKTDQYHLCFTCHMMVHCRFKYPNDWSYYAGIIRHGGCYAAFYKRNIVALKARHLSGKQPAPDELGALPQSSILDEIGAARER